MSKSQPSIAQPLWIVGPARSGKTERLVRQFVTWQQADSVDTRTIFCFAANSELRQVWSRRLQQATENRVAIVTFTPQGFFQAEVLLYWPLLRAQLGLLARFPLVLKPENEQELAEQLFAPELDSGELAIAGLSRQIVVRQILDNLQLAASAGVPAGEIGERLVRGRSQNGSLAPEVLQLVGRLANRFRDRALAQGLLTYSAIAELYAQHLLPHPLYREQLGQRCQYVLADDVDDYPAIAADLFEYLLQHDTPSCFSCGELGSVRLGYGADPEAIADLSRWCDIEHLPSHPVLATDLEQVQTILFVPDSLPWFSTPSLEQIVVLQQPTRRQLLRQMCHLVTTQITTGEAVPSELAIVGPGLDPVAIYTIKTLLQSADIPVRILDTSQPLWASPLVRTLLALMALVYPHCGDVLVPEAIAELLTVASGMEIDPVRAGLLSDRCFQPQLDRPQLLASTSDPRRDRLGAKASVAYDRLADWVTRQQQQSALPLLSEFFDEAIHTLWLDRPFSYAQVAAYRTLLDVVQRYEAVAARLGQARHTIARSFYDMLASGTITAKPDTSDLDCDGVVLGTIYQYRAAHLAHRRQLWLDAGSSLWNTAYSSLGALQLKNPYLYLRQWDGEAWLPEHSQAALDSQLERAIADLMHRCLDQIVLCFSEQSITGQEATGPLLPLQDCAAWLSLDISSASE